MPQLVCAHYSSKWYDTWYQVIMQLLLCNKNMEPTKPQELKQWAFISHMSTGPNNDPKWAWLDSLFILSGISAWLEVKVGLCWHSPAVLHVSLILLWNQWGWLRHAFITMESVQEEKWIKQMLLSSSLRTSMLISALFCWPKAVTELSPKSKWVNSAEMHDICAWI